MRRRFLVIRQDRIGDCVLATALPRELKRRWPGCRVTMLTRSATAPLFAHNPHVDEIWTDDWDDPDRREPFRSLVGRLRRGRFTHALMLLPQARYNYATFCAGIPVRVGHGIILFHALTLVRPVMTRKFRKGRHEADYALDLARAVGVRSRDVTPEIHLTPRESAESAQRRALWCSDAGDMRVVGVHSTSGGSAPNWPPRVWSELVRLLVATKDLKVVLTDPSPPAELRQVPGAVIPEPPRDLRDGVVNFAALDVLVSASTGPMHICGALGVPTVSLFCPLPSCAPDLWGPLGNRAEHVLPRPDYCRDLCPGDPHICDYRGDSGVDPAAVARRVTAILGGGGQSSGSS